MIEFIAIAVIFLVSFFDALRDAWMKKESWWKRHIVKWVSFYSPLVFITIVHVSWQLWLPVTVMSWIIWRLSVRFVGGQNWPTHWSRYF